MQFVNNSRLKNNQTQIDNVKHSGYMELVYAWLLFVQKKCQTLYLITFSTTI